MKYAAEWANRIDVNGGSSNKNMLKILTIYNESPKVIDSDYITRGLYMNKKFRRESIKYNESGNPNKGLSKITKYLS